ncbi:MAG: hypothetical protein L3K06_00405 [Thermoplasmata archaeon]|nr:hypothetical protein [Thermoplasmata archaeon]
MIRLLVTVVAIAAAVLLIVASLATTPRTLRERPTLLLLPMPTGGPALAYCMPVGTLFTFAWATSDGGSATVVIFSPALLVPYQYEARGASGQGALFSPGYEYFVAGNLTSPAGHVVMTLDFNVSVPVFASGPPSGPCL